jgi:hypothetical protein
MQLRMNGDEVMLAISRSSKSVMGLGQQVFTRKTNKLLHFTVMAQFNAEDGGPPPMIVGPNSKTAKQVHTEFQGQCLITSNDNGWVNCKAWIEWATVFCERRYFAHTVCF